MSNISIVIVSKDQATEIKHMASVLQEQLPNIERLFVLNRCIDNSKQVMTELGEKFIEITEGVGFRIATAKNVGLQHVNPDNDVLFIDGDRYPHNISIELINTALKKFDITVLKCENEISRLWVNNEFTKNPNQHRLYNDVWGCGFVIRRSAIEKIKNINNGRLYTELFNGSWGEEDQNIGDMSYCLDLTCGAFPMYVYLNGELNYHMATTPQARKQYNIRKLLRMALCIKFNKQIDNDAEAGIDHSNDLKTDNLRYS